MDIIKQAREARASIEEAAQRLPDDEIPRNVNMLPHWKKGETYGENRVVQYEGAAWRVKSAHTSNAPPPDAVRYWGAVPGKEEE